MSQLSYGSLDKTSSQDQTRNNRIGTSVLQSILDTRIKQMIALTLPTDSKRQQILNQISDLPTFSKKLTSFLDFMIGQITSLSVDMNKYKSEMEKSNEQISLSKESQKENSKAYEDRINHIAELLGTSDENIEPKIQTLIKKTQIMNTKGQRDYEKCLSLLNCQQSKAEESIKLLLAENDRLQRMVTQDRSLLLRQNEELRKQLKKNKDLKENDASASNNNKKHSKPKRVQFVESSSDEDDSELKSDEDLLITFTNQKPLMNHKNTIKELQELIDDLKHDADRLGSKFH